MFWNLEVVYRSYGFDRDDQIQKAVGKLDWASGSGPDGRDLSFRFRTKKAAAEAEQKVKALGGLRTSIRQIKYD
jgi:hypothetical protein